MPRRTRKSILGLNHSVIAARVLGVGVVSCSQSGSALSVDVGPDAGEASTFKSWVGGSFDGTDLPYIFAHVAVDAFTRLSSHRRPKGTALAKMTTMAEPMSAPPWRSLAALSKLPKAMSAARLATT